MGMKKAAEHGRCTNLAHACGTALTRLAGQWEIMFGCMTSPRHAWNPRSGPFTSISTNHVGEALIQQGQPPQGPPTGSSRTTRSIVFANQQMALLPRTSQTLCGGGCASSRNLLRQVHRALCFRALTPASQSEVESLTAHAAYPAGVRLLAAAAGCLRKANWTVGAGRVGSSSSADQQQHKLQARWASASTPATLPEVPRRLDANGIAQRCGATLCLNSINDPAEWGLAASAQGSGEPAYYWCAPCSLVAQTALGVHAHPRLSTLAICPVG